MRWEFVIALIIAIPIILFPAAFIWYMNIGRIYAAVKGALMRRRAKWWHGLSEGNGNRLLGASSLT